MQPKQLRLLELLESGDSEIIAFGGARGGAKSHAVRSINLIRRLKYPGTHSLVFRRTFPELNRNHLIPLFAEYPELRVCYNTQSKILTLPNGSTIEFATADYDGRLKKFQGAEWQDIYVDEATHLVQADIEWLRTCLRRGSTSRITPRMVLTANPGGVGHAYVKRLFIDRQYHENEDKTAYAFLQSYAQDNVEWARDALEKDGISVKEYYEWDDKRRLEYFISRTQYGRNLNSLPQRMRDAHLYGRWDVFAGQYFDIFDPARHVRSYKELQLEDWHPRWLGFDWGFDHPSAALFFAHNGERYVVYREIVVAGLPPRQVATRIGQTVVGMNEKITDVYLSPDCFARKQDEHTIAREMGEVFVGFGLSQPTRGVADRISGWAFIYDLLNSDQLWIDASCKNLIETIPRLIRDEDKPEDILKADGDDTADALKLGLMSRLRQPHTRPLDDLVWEKIPAQMDPTFVAMRYRSVEAKLKKITGAIFPRKRIV